MATLHVLGCSDAFNSGGRRHTSFLLEKSGYKILIDCGANTSLGFKQTGQSFREVDYLLITHFHGDHYGGLPFLILEAAKVKQREKPLTIVSPPGLKDKLYQLMSLLYKGSEDALEAFPIHYLEYASGEKMELPFGNLLAYEVQHTPEALPHGLRLELEGKILAYSGDTSWHPNLQKLAEGADLFICECNFLEERTAAHLDYHTLQEKNSQLNARKIFLTHMGEGMLEKINGLELDGLRDGQVISF